MSLDISDNDDDLSDVSMPEESDDSESDSELSGEDEDGQGRRHQSQTLDHPQTAPTADNTMVDMQPINETGHKQMHGAQPAAETAKRPSTTNGRMFVVDFDKLPLEVWQHIFTFTATKTLGCLLRVNKAINSLLDPESPYPTPAPPLRRSSVPIRQPEDIWQLSRKRFRPRMPAPLDGMTELSMWRLACTLRCASCGKKSGSSASSTSHDQWRGGPGENGVRPIWAFATSACGPCLKSQTVKEIDLLLSASLPSSLICALPFIFLTNELHVVASTALHQGQQPPSSIQISKYFLKSDVESIKKEYFKVKGLGNAAAEEWVKGLDNRGKAKRLDIARWERWEVSGGLQRLRKDEPDNLPEKAVQQSLPSSLPPRPATFHGYSGFGQPPHAGSAYPPPPGVATHSGPGATNFAPGLPQRLDSPSLYGAYGPPGTQKAPRTKEEAEKLKLARRTEIERRCRELDPPISPSVLVHMPSFQASLHIIKPLDDTAWDMLKPRLLSQRADAEQREKERLASTRVFQQHQTARQSLDGPSQRSEESVEREWEETQVIVRNRIGPYSDEIIRDGWGSGSKVTKETSPRFAAEVLMYVRKRFYAEIAKDDAAAMIAGHPPMMDPPNGPFTRKLTLENMRWVFETKIKHHTDQHRKEIFLCNACDTIKWYAFEGVCQHYASKHTASLSSGSVVVHWRAEWPEEPPFKPEPHLARRPTIPASEAPEPFPNGVPAPAPVLGYPPPPGPSTTQAGSSVPAAPVYSSQITQLAQQPQFLDPYNQQAVNYMAPGAYQPYAPSTQMQQYPGPPGSIYAPFYQPPAPELYPNPTMSLPQASLPLNQVYMNSAPIESAMVNQQSAPLAVVDTQSHIPPPVYRTEAYKAQLQDMALTAKALWTETAGVKDMPGSVRVHVILFHVLQRLRERYTEDPPLSMFVDGIQNVKEMRIVRNVNGLACKPCIKENANKPVNPYTVSAKASAASDRKLYSLPQLVNHFQSAHSDKSAGASAVDWRTDMVELPDKKKIRSLEGSTGMDEQKLRLLMEALPDAFRPDTPKANNNDLAPSVDKHESYYDINNIMRLGRSASPEINIRKLFNPAVDNYPREYSRGRPSGAAAAYAGGHMGGSNMKRKATSPLSGRRLLLPADNVRHLEALLDEDEEQRNFEGDRPPNAPQSYLTRPEYNHRDVDLSRLLANTGHVAQPEDPTARPGELVDSPVRTFSRVSTEPHRDNNQAKTAAERFLDDMTPGEPLTQSLGSQRRQREAAAAGRPTRLTEHHDSGRSTRVQYIYSQAERQQITGKEKFRRLSPDDGLPGGHTQRRSAELVDERYVRDDARFVEYRPAQSQAPSREIRYAQPEVIRFADERRASGSPVYVVEEPSRRRQYRAVSPGGQHFIDEPVYEPRPVVRRGEEPAYDQRQEYYQYTDEQPRPRQVQYESEVEYIRVRDPAGDYLVERPKPREQPIYARYDDSNVGRQPMYEDSRMRAVYEDEHVPVRISQGSHRPRQIVYADEARPRAVRYEDDETEQDARYEERPRPAVTRADGDGVPILYEEHPQPQQQIIYDDEPEWRQAVYERNPLNSLPMSKSDPAYYEEYDPHNPAPLLEAPRRMQRHE